MLGLQFIWRVNFHISDPLHLQNNRVCIGVKIGSKIGKRRPLTQAKSTRQTTATATNLGGSLRKHPWDPASFPARFTYFELSPMGLEKVFPPFSLLAALDGGF